MAIFFKVSTYWSSVPKNLTKKHFLPLGFFKSFGGLTTCRTTEGTVIRDVVLKSNANFTPEFKIGQPAEDINSE